MTSNQADQKKAAVIGAGLVGCLAAIMLAKQGFAVDLYEGRQDPRKQTASTSRARSINLAVSTRGINALKSVDQVLADKVLQGLVPMTGRMIHSLDGKQLRQAYGLTGQEAINSIDRAIFNTKLMDEIDAYPSVRLRFGYKLLQADYDTGHLVFAIQGGDRETVDGIDLVIGCDGAFSKVREQMMRVSRMDFQQSYIQHGYLELSMPPRIDIDGKPQYAIDPNHLHIWPRHLFMLIALPNLDKSFTCTLFAPFSTLDQLHSDKDVLDFCTTHFADAVPLIGRVELLRCFAEHPRSPLLSIQVDPLHYKGKAVLLGDSSHCMVPFYGQGMNCGFEDVRILQQHLQKSPDDLEVALAAYTEQRRPALVAIQQLAQQNYEEMASKVVDPLYLFRKQLDGILTSWLGQDIWCPLYTMVTFRDDLSYDQVVQTEQRQQKIVVNTLYALGVTALAGFGWAIKKNRAYLRF